MNVVQENQWDITDVYESDINGGDPEQDVMYIMTYLEEGEVVQIREYNSDTVAPDLKTELVRDLADYDGTERIFVATVTYAGTAGNVRINATRYWKETIPGTGFLSILVLEDSSFAGRPRKKKRTSNAVTDIKPKP